MAPFVLIFGVVIGIGCLGFVADLARRREPLAKWLFGLVAFVIVLTLLISIASGQFLRMRAGERDGDGCVSGPAC